VKVVEGSEIYNFPIHHFVHFYSTFWSFTRSNRDTMTQLRPADAVPAPRRRTCRVCRASDRPPPRCPGPADAPSRGASVPSQAACAPSRLETPPCIMRHTAGCEPRLGPPVRPPSSSCTHTEAPSSVHWALAGVCVAYKGGRRPFASRTLASPPP
jgi:hypothetical protein